MRRPLVRLGALVVVSACGTAPRTPAPPPASPQGDAAPRAPSEPAPAPPPTAADPQAAALLGACQRLHTEVIHRLETSPRADALAAIRELADAYRELRRRAATGELGACRRLIEPTIAAVAEGWYLEGRPGHPGTYPTTRELLQIDRDLFPDADRAALMTYRLAQVTAVLAGDEPSLWREAARLYEQAVRLDPQRTATVRWRGRPANLVVRASWAHALCLSNAVDPYAEPGDAHDRAIAALTAYLDRVTAAADDDDADLRTRLRILAAISGRRNHDALEALLEAVHEAGDFAASVAADLLVLRLADAPAADRRRWAERLLASPAADNANLRPCLLQLQRSATPCERPPRQDWWIGKPW